MNIDVCSRGYIATGEPIFPFYSWELKVKRKGSVVEVFHGGLCIWRQEYSEEFIAASIARNIKYDA